MLQGTKKAFSSVADVLGKYIWANDFSSAAYEKAYFNSMLQYFPAFYNPHLP